MMTLTTARPGDSVRVVRLDAPPEVCHRLREMGFGEDRVVRCLQTGQSCVCQVQHARVGLSCRLAGRIIVERLR